jgi:hypothetical protein
LKAGKSHLGETIIGCCLGKYLGGNIAYIIDNNSKHSNPIITIPVVLISSTTGSILGYYWGRWQDKSVFPKNIPLGNRPDLIQKSIPQTDSLSLTSPDYTSLNPNPHPLPELPACCIQSD